MLRPAFSSVAIAEVDLGVAESLEPDPGGTAEGGTELDGGYPAGEFGKDGGLDDGEDGVMLRRRSMFQN